MAKPSSSPSSEALLSLISSSSLSPISCSEYPICKDKYLPYVLVKGSMSEPRCSKAEQRKSCIEEEGIGMDEMCGNISSVSIPSEVPYSYNIQVNSSLKSASLPPSPKKAAIGPKRSIEELRAAIAQMKEPNASSIPQQVHYTNKPAKGTSNLSPSFGASNSLNAGSKKKIHHSHPDPHALDSSSLCSVFANPYMQYPSQVIPTKLGHQLFQLPQSLPYMQNTKPLDKNLASPPTHLNSNSPPFNC